MKKNMIIFNGFQRKKYEGQWQRVFAVVDVDSIISAAFINNSSSCVCFSCKYFDDGYCRIHNGEYEYQNECKYLDWNREDGEDDEKKSYIEIETEKYIYQFFHNTLCGYKDGKLKYNSDLIKIAKKTIKCIQERKSFDVEDAVQNYEEKIKKESQSRQEAWEKKHWFEEFRIRPMCPKYCFASKDGKCLIGFKCCDGIPKEPCVRADYKSYIESFKKNLIKYGVPDPANVKTVSIKAYQKRKETH